MKWLRWSGLGLMIFIGVLLALLPAATVLHFIPLPKDISITGVSGSIWQGRAASLTLQRYTAYQLEWQLAVVPLLKGELQVTVSAGQNPQSQLQLDGMLRARSASQWQAEQVKFSFPVALIASYQALPFQMKLQGRLRGYIAEAKPAVPWCQALDADLVWQQASIASRYLKPALELKEVEAKLSCAEGDLLATIRDPQQVLGMDLSLRLDQQKQLFANGVLSPAGELPKSVKQGLQFFAQPQKDGSYRVQFDTQL